MTDNPVAKRIREYMLTMAPHIKARMQAKLLAEAADEIERLERELDVAFEDYDDPET